MYAANFFTFRLDKNNLILIQRLKGIPERRLKTFLRGLLNIGLVSLDRATMNC